MASFPSANHPVTQQVQSLYRLGQGCYNDYHHQQALTYYAQALQQIETAPNHSMTLQQIKCDIYQNIAIICIRQYELIKANRFACKVQGLALKLQDQMRFTQSLDIQGDIKKYQRKDRQALKDYMNSLEIKLYIMNDETLHVANSYHKIANMYMIQGKYDGAFPMYEKALRIRLQKLGDNHPDVAISYYKMAHFYYKQNQYDAAYALCQKALKIELKTSHEQHPIVAHLYYNLGRIECSQNKYDHALDWFQKSLQIEVQTYGDYHPHIANLYCDIGLTYSKQGKYEQALDMLHKSLKVRLQVLDQHHPDVVTSYQHIASIYHYQQQYDQSIAMYKKAKLLLSQQHGHDPSKMATLYDSMATSYAELHRYKTAYALRKRSRQILNRSHKNMEMDQKDVLRRIKSEDVVNYFPLIANIIGSDWTKFVAASDLSIDVNVVRAENHLLYDQAMTVLHMWYAQNAPDVGIHQLLNLFQQMGRADISIRISDSLDKKNYYFKKCTIL